MSDPETITVYDNRADDYARKLGNDPVASIALRAFIADLPAGGLVLDLGCGPGTWAAAMARAGLKVEAFDASTQMVALTSQHPDVTVWQAEFSDLNAAERYDGIWANFSLLHAPRTHMPDHLRSISRALKPGGIVHIGLKYGDGTARDGLGRLYSYYTPESLAPMLDQAGLTPGPARQGKDKGLDGTPARWFTVTATKEGS